MSKPKKPAQPARVRAVGPPRNETFEIPLAPDDVERLHNKLLDQLDHREEIKQQLANAKKTFDAQLKTNETAIDTIRRQIRQGVDRRTIQVQDYLTKSNEIVRVAVVSDTILGEPRTATAAELQEELPLHDAHAPGENEEAEQDEADDDGTPFDPVRPADLDALPAFDA